MVQVMDWRWTEDNAFPEPVNTHPDSKIHGANMGPIWGRQDPGGLHFGPMNFAIWAVQLHILMG